MRLVFIDSSLELVPKEIARHPVVLRDAKRRGKRPNEILLDDSKHHRAMVNLKNRKKRGRPDIVHQCLLLALDSGLEIDVFVHTVDGTLIWINKETRLPRNYNRFVGLMEDLFKKRVISSNGVLMEITDLKLSDVLEGFKVVVMSEKGSQGLDRLRSLISKKTAVCIGAFPHGDFEEDTLEILRDFNAEFVALAKEPLTSLYITNRVICIYEDERI